MIDCKHQQKYSNVDKSLNN